MKLVFAIIDKSDAQEVMSALTVAGYASTLTDSTGGFSNRSNAMLLVGVENSRTNQVIEIIGRNTHNREESVSEGVDLRGYKLPEKIIVGGAVVFVVNVEQFMKL